MKEFDMQDIRLETYQLGSGFKYVNGIKVTHLPTGISARCDSERSQYKNEYWARQQLNYLLKQQTDAHKQLELF